jgi:hypothetical protein
MRVNFFGDVKPKPTPGKVIKRLLVRCPTTAKLTPTGRSVDESLWGESKVKGAGINCLHCGKVHQWTKKDVILAR